MKKILSTLLVILVSVNIAFGASTKVSELTETQTLTNDDIFLVSTYLTGNYTSKFIKTQYLKTILQPYDADLTTYAGITPSANVQSLLGSADYAAMRTNLGLVIGTNVQAYDADLTTYAGITPSANIQSFLGSANYSAARTNLGLAIGSDVQAYNAALGQIAGLSCTENQIIKMNGSSTWVCATDGGSGSVATDAIWDAKGDLAVGTGSNTAGKLAVGTANQILHVATDTPAWTSTLNLQIDDSAAQFKSATASKGTLKFDQTGISDTKLVTVKYTAADSYTYTPTLVGNVSHLLGTTWTNGKWCSYSTSTGLTCNEDAPAGSGDVTGAGDCASGACYDGSSDGGTYIRLYDGTSAYEALTGGVRKFTFSSSTANSEDLSITLGDNDNTVTLSSSTGVTKASLSALNLVTTGTISGKIPMISKSGNYTLGTDNAQEAYGYMVWLTGDGTILTLPAVAAGMSVCVYSADSYDKVVNPNDNDGIRNGTTTRNADGHAITSGATDQGSFVCLVGDSADGWTVLGKTGTWTDE